jgi:hypothetical protein
MRRFILPALACTAFLTTALADEYTSEAGKFTVTFPGKTKEKTKLKETTVPLPDGTKTTMHSAHFEYADNNDEYSYLASYTDYPENTLKVAPQKILAGVRDDRVKGGRLLDDKEITYGDDKVPGREFAIENDQQGFMRFRVYLRGTRLYQIAVTAVTNEGIVSQKSDKYLDSFKIAK